MINYDEWASEFVGKHLHTFTHRNHVGNWICSCGGSYNGYDGLPNQSHLDASNFLPTTSDSDYLELVRYAMKHALWYRFIEFLLHEYWRKSNTEMIVWDTIIHLLFDRERGTKAIYEFFKEEENEC